MCESDASPLLVDTKGISASWGLAQEREKTQVNPRDWTPFRRFLVNILDLCLLTLPLILEFCRGEVTQRGMDTLVRTDLVKKPTQLMGSISTAHTVR